MPCRDQKRKCKTKQVSKSSTFISCRNCMHPPGDGSTCCLKEGFWKLAIFLASFSVSRRHGGLAPVGPQSTHDRDILQLSLYLTLNATPTRGIPRTIRQGGVHKIPKSRSASVDVKLGTDQGKTAFWGRQEHTYGTVIPAEDLNLVVDTQSKQGISSKGRLWILLNWGRRYLY